MHKPDQNEGKKVKNGGQVCVVGRRQKRRQEWQVLRRREKEASQISRATEPWHVLATKHLGTTLIIF